VWLRQIGVKLVLNRLAISARELSKSNTMGEAKRKRAKAAGSMDDPNFQKSIVTQSFEQTCKLLDEPQLDDFRALILTHRGRDGMLDQAAMTYAHSGKAECQAGCSACCHQMVLCTPFEVFSIARHLLDSKTAADLEAVKDRLERLAGLPLHPDARYGIQNPCALLDNNRCSIYEQRPSVCRTLLWASRAAYPGPWSTLD
jgi:Putative zinc- or iron-chelating domain